jgi:hypothetical protein
MSYLVLAETLSGDWVITVPNPEEEFCSTEFARFEVSSTAEGTPARAAIMRAAAYTALSLAFEGRVLVQSHSTDNREAMTRVVMAHGPAEGVEVC